MLKIIIIILTMAAGGIFYHSFLAEKPDFMEVFSMLYWSIVLTIAFIVTGVIKLEMRK